MEQQQAGSVVALWRYPVKSMMGEELNASAVTDRGLLGDRAYGLVDRSDGKVASAKNPRKWPRLFDFRAAYVDSPRRGAGLPAVRITLPDGTALATDQADLNSTLSRELHHEVTLEEAERGRQPVVESTLPNPWAPRAEEYWPDMEGLDYRDTVTEPFPVAEWAQVRDTPRAARWPEGAQDLGRRDVLPQMSSRTEVLLCPILSATPPCSRSGSPPWPSCPAC
jgi:hypothetical protein